MPSRRAAGYTLIEVVVALLIFSVGALALAASSAIVARSMQANAFRERALRLATSRIEMLKSECAAAASGSETVGTIQSQWTATGSAGAIAISETTRYASGSGMHTENYRATLPCSP